MQTALITGTSKGLGEALASKFHSEGWFVIGLSRSIEDDSSDESISIRGDVTDPMIGEKIADKIKSVESIDVLINNAGHGSFGSRLSAVDPEEVLHQANLHCVGALRMVKAVQEKLLSSKNSKVVNITSRLGSVQQHLQADFKGMEEFSYGYRIGKSAQNMLSLCLQGDPDLKDVLVLSVVPGRLLTDSGAADAEHSASEGAERVYALVTEATSSGIYHAFGDTALY